MLNVPANNNHAEHVEILNKLAEMEKIPTYNNLDNIITDKEITVGINSLKNGKSAGPDGISNEMLKCGQHILLRPLNRLFNSVLFGGTYPEAWAKGYIVPIHTHKGQPRWLSGLRRSHVHSLMIARRSLCPEKLGSNPGQGSKGINFSDWHGLDMSITVTKRR